MTDLFEPLTLRGVTFKNRIGVSPMCQYCCNGDGKPTEWHLAHLLTRAVGGAGMVMAEASAVTPEGRITPGDLGIWEDAQVPGHARLARGIAALGAVPAIQIAHAGRKASRGAPWNPGPADPAWTCLAPSAVAFDDFAVPQAMSEADIAQVIASFAAAAKRSVLAGYRFIEIHAAHGYLLHQFLSPLSNQRNDAWGGDFDGRSRLPLEIAAAVRAAVPDDLPLAMRISHTEWVTGGWDTPDSIELARRLKALGVDIMDVSSGGNDPAQKIVLGPGYQVPGAAAVRQGADMPVAAVGLITEPTQAQAILTAGKADLILLARVLLHDPYWPLKASIVLGHVGAVQAPPQYDRGWGMVARVGMDRALAAPMPAL